MSAPIRTFVFYDRQTHTEIYRKRSYRTDFTFGNQDFYSLEVDAKEVSLSNDDRFRFLKEKIKAAIWLRATFALIADGVNEDFSPESLKAVQVSPTHQSKFEALMAQEQKILCDRIADNQWRFESSILAAQNDEELSAEILLMRKNVLVGIYSPIEREWKKIRGVY